MSVSLSLPPNDNITSQDKSSLKFSEMTRILETLKSSNKLSMPDLFFGDEGAFEIAKFLQENKHFVTMELRGNNISALGFEAICESLKGSDSIKKISVEWNNIGSENLGIIALNEFIQTNNTILSIDLRNNKIGPSCAGAISNIIRVSSSLKFLDLRWNELGDEGAKLILFALQDHPGKVQVDLSGNKISHEILMELDMINSERTTHQSSQLASIRESNRPLEINQSFRSTPHTPQRSSLYNKENLRTENTSSQDHPYMTAHDSTHPVKTVINSNVSINASPLGRKKNFQTSSNVFLKSQINQNYPLLSTNRSQVLSSLVGNNSTGTNYNAENDIREIKERYLNETKQIEQKCSIHIQMHMKMANLVNNLEKINEEERELSEQKDAKIQELTTILKNEVNKRQEVESSYNQLLNELHQRDKHIGEMTHEIEQYRNDNVQMGRFIEELKFTNAEIQEEFQNKINETNKRYAEDLSTLTNSNDELRNHIEKIQNEFNHQIHQIHIANEENGKLYEEKLNNAIMATTELAEELKKKQNEIDNLQTQHLENIKKAFEQGQNEEFQKAQKAIFDLDQELRLLQSENEKINLEHENLIEELNGLNKQKQIEQKQFEEKINLLEYQKQQLENEIQIVTHSIENLKDDLAQKKELLSKVEAENIKIKLDLKKSKEEHDNFAEKLKKNNELDRKRTENTIEELKKRVKDLEIDLKESRDETQRVTEEYDKLGDMLKGNISKLISQTFNDHEKLKTPLKSSTDSKY